jgi:putative hydrolase of the HAD superfamily
MHLERRLQELVMNRFDVIAFDADDTLWHNESLYAATQDRFKDMLAPYHSPEMVEKALYETEMRNLQLFGYGIKAFALSMIETAIELTDGKISGQELKVVVDQARWMLETDIQVFEHVEEVLGELAGTHDLMLITKGDLLDQEGKIARSGLGDHFRYVEIVSDKTREIYATILARHQIDPPRFLMVGNSMRSDILPVLELGGQAVYIPHHLTWAHEHATPTEERHNGFYELEHIGQLLNFLKTNG